MKIWTAGERLLAADLNANFDNPAKAEGTFTPTIEGSTTPGVATYTTQTGRYYRIGRLVFLEVRVVWTAHTGTGTIKLGGLPFAISCPVAGVDSAVLGPVNTGLTLAAPMIVGRDGNTYGILVTAAPSAGVAVVGAATINATLRYRTAAA